MPGATRLPPSVDGFSVNFCKSTQCENFLVPPNPVRPRRARGSPRVPGDYTVVSGGRGVPLLKCELCGEHSPIRSNLAVAEEVTRQARYFVRDPRHDPSCKDPDCESFKVPLSKAADAYVRSGTTNSGTQRYRCKLCNGTFVGKGHATARQRLPHKNRDIFMLTVNKVPISRILETTGIGFDSFYRKLNFIHVQCQAFAGQRESRLLAGKFTLPKMYLSTDRQAYIVNWVGRKDRRTVQMNAIGTADQRSGYVFGMALNFDDRLHKGEVETDAVTVGDIGKSPPHRKYARVWLDQDYTAAMANSENRDAAEQEAIVRSAGLVSTTPPLLIEVGIRYMDAMVRDDIEQSEFKNEDVKLPNFGMGIHEQYTMYGHFVLLAKLLRTAPKVRLFMDQDSGFRAAAISAFGSMIKARTADAFFVKVDKAANAYEKQNAVAAAKAAVLRFMEDESIPDEKTAIVEMMKLEIKKSVSMTHWKDRWVRHVNPIAAEPSKYVCWLTKYPADDGEEDFETHHARLLLRGTLHPIDKFFLQTRRRVSLAERAVISVRKQRRMWNGYGAYNPAILQRYLEVYRTYYNYCLPGKDKKTPAMRLGLAKAPIDPHTVLHCD
jgi:transposase-like protein